jgi:hypothetical protein
MQSMSLLLSQTRSAHCIEQCPLSGATRNASARTEFFSVCPLAEVSRQRALPRGDAEVTFQRKLFNQGLFFRSLGISFGFAKPRV